MKSANDIKVLIPDSEILKDSVLKKSELKSDGIKGTMVGLIFLTSDLEWVNIQTAILLAVILAVAMCSSLYYF